MCGYELQRESEVPPATRHELFIRSQVVRFSNCHETIHRILGSPMKKNEPNREAGERARSLRKTQTDSEGLLWSVLRARQLCGLKFRRQHPIESWIVDFACQDRMLVVEVDGGYHDHVEESDLRRQRHLESLGWKVMRFSDKDVEDDAEAVARAIARELNLAYEFRRRQATGSGARQSNTKPKR
jgi:very-short-patch-repair endonuclease